MSELIQQFKPIGEKYERLGVWQSVLYAIILKESRYLKSSLTTKYNNCGGVKGKLGNGYKTAYVSTKEVDNGKVYKTRARFKVYDNLLDCAEDMCYTLCGSRYRHFREATSLYEACLALQDNYGFDINYGESLYKWVKELGFDVYDNRENVQPFLGLRVIYSRTFAKLPTEYKYRRFKAIYLMQTALHNLNYNIAIDGKFGSGTRKIVKLFQKSAGQKQDGIIGIKTWKQLFDNQAVNDESVESEKVEFVGTKHFKPSEVDPQGIASGGYAVNLQYATERLETFRVWLNKAINITGNGGYTKTGHSGSSMHYVGVAFDIYVKDMTPKELGLKVLEFFEPEYYFELVNAKACDKMLKEIGCGLGGSSIVHVDFGKWAKENGFENYGSARPAIWFYNGYKDIMDWYTH